MTTARRLGLALALSALLASPARSGQPDTGRLRIRQLTVPESPRVYFPASRFIMGSSPDDMIEAVAECAREPNPSACSPEHFAHEGALHRVTLSEFWLDRYEVTVEAYERCVELGRCEPVSYYRGALRFRQPRFPQTLVPYADALAFCHFVGGSLPTEAQFERAARGLTRRRYPWGEVYNPRRSNHGRLSFDTTDPSDGYAELGPVDAFSSGVTPERVFNLAGNVEEWVRDRYASEYPLQAQNDPQGPDETAGATDRVVRGGSFLSAAPWLRGAARDFASPEATSPARGFRCAYSRAVQSPTSP